METTISAKGKKDTWMGGNMPFNVKYGKMMMWFFIVSDALTFGSLLCAYAFARMDVGKKWPIADEVFTHFPFIKGEHPMMFVGLMTFILIVSSVTMVISVNHAEKRNKSKVLLYLGLTIIGGIIFLGSQAWEWGHFIHGDKGGLKLENRTIAHLVDNKGKLLNINELVNDGDSIIHRSITSKENVFLRLDDKSIVKDKQAMETYLKGARLINGANLRENEYGKILFANMFFFITGFHGTHVLSGVILNIIIFINVLLGVYERKKNYDMIEKVGLYWHFVDLVWVFVFTFFYLV